MRDLPVEVEIAEPWLPQGITMRIRTSKILAPYAANELVKISETYGKLRERVVVENILRAVHEEEDEDAL